MAYLELGNGKQAIVDNEDVVWLQKYNWRYNKKDSYAEARKKIDGRWKTILMHRLIIKCPEGLETDHKNGQRLDNRKENLRVATHRQNSFNQLKQANRTSNFKGVTFNKRLNKFVAQIKSSGKQVHIGVFRKEEHAAMTFGEFAKTNFIVV